MSRTQQQATADERLVERWFVECLGFTVERIPRHLSEQRPDLRVLTPEGAVLFCEVKSISSTKDETWILHSTMGNAVSDALHRAAPQFRWVNSAHLVPNVLALVSHSYRLSDRFFAEFARGYLVVGDERVSLAPQRFGRAAEAFSVVDLFLWFQQDDSPAQFFANPGAFVGSLRKLLYGPLPAWPRTTEPPDASL